MADIVLRNLGDALKEKLRRSAALHRRSMNASVAAKWLGDFGARVRELP